MEKEEYAVIIDKGECMSTLYQYPTFPWPEAFLKTVACKDEWTKHGFYPSNGLVGEIAYNMESQIYILKINDKFFVPMTRKGIQFISEMDYYKKKASNNIQEMDERQRKISNDWDKFTNNF